MMQERKRILVVVDAGLHPEQNLLRMSCLLEEFIRELLVRDDNDVLDEKLTIMIFITMIRTKTKKELY